MVDGDTGNPNVLIPYPGPCDDSHCQDVFVYLRPETNGVRAESTLLKVTKKPEYRDRIAFVYLANMPGDFIVRHQIVEEHYAVRLHFATVGRSAFTPHMEHAFEGHFGVSCDRATILGSFDALHVLGLSEEQLFGLRVPVCDVLWANGQSVKRIGSIFVVNYDIPALLHKNSQTTDVAVMIFRTALRYEEFHGMVREMEEALVKEGILNPDTPFSRAFHYSKSPFEQVLDAMGYLYEADGTHVPMDDTSFCVYARSRGLRPSEVMGAVRHPIMHFMTESGETVEDNLLHYTYEHTYADAVEKLLCSTLCWRLPQVRLGERSALALTPDAAHGKIGPRATGRDRTGGFECSNNQSR